MQRFNYKLTVEYDGRFFHGWQSQKGMQTAQDVLKKALSDVTQQPICLYGAGRTDQGVHATGQVVHISLTKEFSHARLFRGTNFFLKPKPLRVTEVQRVPLSFHARFSALQRQYRYRVLNRPSLSPLRAGYVWWVPRKLNYSAMCQAAALCEGTHDFSSFRGRFCQAASPVRTIDMLRLEKVADELHIIVHARSFLHHQVRLLVGTLVQIGWGRFEPLFMHDLLKNPARGRSGVKAPAEGLCLERVLYPAQCQQITTSEEMT